MSGTWFRPADNAPLRALQGPSSGEPHLKPRSCASQGVLSMEVPGGPRPQETQAGPWQVAPLLGQPWGLVAPPGQIWWHEAGEPVSVLLRNEGAQGSLSCPNPHLTSFSSEESRPVTHLHRPQDCSAQVS